MKNFTKKEVDLSRNVSERAKLHVLAKQWGIVLKASCIVLVILALRFYISHLGYDVIPLNSLITALLGGVFFTIGILLSGAISDYKEAEKIPGELAVSIKTMYNDTEVITVKPKHDHLLTDLRSHVVNLLSVLNSNFRRNVWKLKEIDSAINAVNKDLRKIGQEGVYPGFITRFRSELTNIDRLSHRVDVISETTFVPASYTIAEVSIASLVLILLFVQMELSPVFAYIILGAISGILISTVLFIKNMDSPFDIGDGFADVDLSILFSLEKYLKKLV